MGLTCGPLHTSAFWAHNGTQKALQKHNVEDLVKLVQKSTGAITMAVACNDIGETAALAAI